MEHDQDRKPADDPPITPTTLLIAEARALRRRAAKARAEIRRQVSESKRLRELLERKPPKGGPDREPWAEFVP